MNHNAQYFFVIRENIENKMQFKLSVVVYKQLKGKLKIKNKKNKSYFMAMIVLVQYTGGE